MKGVPQGMKADVISRKIIKAVNSAVNLTILTVVMLLIAFSGYALWDSNQIHYAADKARYAIYKPSIKNDGKSFKELQAVNPEITAWLSIYGTNIDYPVAQGPNNMKYINANAEGRYSLSGSIFIDSGNSRDFSDFNLILYGHHMAKKVMFGEIGDFSDKKIFDSHRYGSLYFDGQEHGIEFFAFLHADAYDLSVFSPGVKGLEERQAYLDNLLAKAMYSRDIGATADDKIILLSTCSSSSTNGRDILIGRLSNEQYDDPFVNTETNNANNQGGFLKEIRLTNIILIALLAVLISIVYYRRKRRKRSRNT